MYRGGMKYKQEIHFTHTWELQCMWKQKAATGKNVGGGVSPHAGFSKIHNKQTENTTLRTFYKLLPGKYDIQNILQSLRSCVQRAPPLQERSIL